MEMISDFFTLKKSNTADIPPGLSAVFYINFM